MRLSHPVGLVVSFVVAGVLAWSPGCSSTNNGTPDGGAGGADGSTGLGGSSSGIIFPDLIKCTVNTQCINTACAGNNVHTIISGTVYDPAGNNPLPGIAVYVPASLPLAALPKGASCGNCNDLYKGTVLASDVTGPDGSFHIIDAPSGASVPIVVQAGKWRAQYTATAQDCIDNQVTQKLRLPKSVSDGPNASLPDIAISTGGLDSLECLLTRIGVDGSEYTGGPGGTGHIHIFQGGAGGANVPGPTAAVGSTPQSPTGLWASEATLQPYDVVLLSCEGGETSGANPSALESYVRMDGGRVFASHFHYKWLTAPGSPFLGYNLGTIRAGSYDTGNITAVVDTSFAQGKAMHDWLALPQVAALTNDQLPIEQSRQNVMTINNPPQTSWINANASSLATAGLSQYFSFDVRQGELICGRLVYSDMHVGAASADYGNALATKMSTQGGIVPTQCNSTAKLSPQELVLEYMLFDLSSCLTPVTQKKPPPTVPK